MYVRREMIPFTPICGEFPNMPAPASKFFGKRSRCVYSLTQSSFKLLIYLL